MNSHADSLADSTGTPVPTRYTRTAMTLHWLIALLMIGNVVLVDHGRTLGLPVETLPESVGTVAAGSRRIGRVDLDLDNS